MMFWQTTRLIGSSALVAAILLASGCGGSSSSGDDADSNGVFDKAELED